MPEVMFSGPEGRLEGRYHHSTDPKAPVALVLHPHPQHGGTMNNKVVYSIFRTFRLKNFSVLRFNFRGVGRSQGSFDHGQGELSDAAAALDWVQGYNPNAIDCWVTGFSFGSWIAMQLLMRRPEIGGFIAVAPPASHYDFNFLAPCPSSGLIIHGGSDEIVPEGEAAKLAQKLASQRNITIDYKSMPGANHFFEDRIDELTTAIDAYLTQRLSAADAA